VIDPKKEAEIARKVLDLTRSIASHESQITRLEREKSDRIRELDQRINREREEIKRLNRQITDLKR
jgi:peptidoglycan hydrolase CwlO-like protein